MGVFLDPAGRVESQRAKRRSLLSLAIVLLRNWLGCSVKEWITGECVVDQLKRWRLWRASVQLRVEAVCVSLSGLVPGAAADLRIGLENNSSGLGGKRRRQRPSQIL